MRPIGETQTKRNLKVTKVTQEQLEEQRLMKERLAFEESVLLELVSQPYLVIKEMDMVEPFVRRALLDWIDAALLNEIGFGVYEGSTELGVKFKLHILGKENVEMRCTDGILWLPDFQLTFTEVKAREKALAGIS